MASGIFAVLDDIAALMDDVAAASKVAVNKTASILSDDLAVNAEKATGFLSSRELPVIWEITKGALINKAIIVPIAILLNIFFPAVIKYVLIVGGFYLAYEGMAKIVEFLFQRPKKSAEVIAAAEASDGQDEAVKIKDAVTTDFILSIEIIIIALGTVLHETLVVQILTVIAIALIATFGVYGIVAVIVRMDDFGYRLIKKSNNEGITASIGKLLVRSLPVVIKALSVIGTIALILVSGGIFDHNVDFLHNQLPEVPSIVKQILYGVVGGLLTLAVVKVVSAIIGKKK